MGKVVLDSRVGSFSEWTDRYKVEVDYIKALGEYKLRAYPKNHD